MTLCESDESEYVTLREEVSHKAHVSSGPCTGRAQSRGINRDKADLWLPRAGEEGQCRQFLWGTMKMLYN